MHAQRLFHVANTHLTHGKNSLNDWKKVIEEDAKLSQREGGERTRPMFGDGERGFTLEFLQRKWRDMKSNGKTTMQVQKRFCY